MRSRRVAKAFGVVVLACALYYLISLFQVWNVGRSDQLRPVDAIIVLGAAQYDGQPSPQLLARLDHAAQLWSENVASFIVVTGGKQPGDRFTESQTSKHYFEKRGVASDLIFEENTGRTTYESLLAVSKFAREKRIISVLIVSDPFHELRSQLIAQELGLIAYVSPTRTGVVQGITALKYNLQEAAGVAIGRIVGFRRVDSWTN
ncbi:MAG: YdcF family protein [Acidimicrobiaceae bacterium]|nr:YdcF family protein [Acidimicrobiaceae bacterium]